MSVRATAADARGRSRKPFVSVQQASAAIASDSVMAVDIVDLWTRRPRVVHKIQRVCGERHGRLEVLVNNTGVYAAAVFLASDTSA